MKNVELLMKHYENLEVTQEEAKSILESVESVLQVDSFQDFIIENLCLFREREYVFNWFFDSEDEGQIDSDLIDFIITSDMVGKDVIDILLEGHENYLKVNNNLYATWWMR